MTLLCVAVPAHAQIARVGPTIPAIAPGLVMRGTDAGYDPVNNLFLVVIGHGPIFGVFTNPAGTPVTPVFAIMDGVGAFGSFPRVKYSPDVNDGGAGGLGGFLVTWNQACGAVNCVFGKLVSYTTTFGPLVQGLQLISDGSSGGSFQESGPAIAYSRTSRRFLVTWRTITCAIQGRFVDISGVASGPVMTLEAGTSRNPSVAWNATTDDFGITYTGWGGGAHASFRRVRASDGLISPVTLFGYSGGTYDTAIEVMPQSGRYLVTWAIHPGTLSAVLDSAGAVIAATYVTGRLGGDQSLGMAFNANTSTALVVSSTWDSLEIGAIEVKADGVPNGTAQLITDGAKKGSNYPMVAVNPVTGQWNTVYARDFLFAVEQFVASAATVLPTPTPPGGVVVHRECLTPDPFQSLGGGTCVNGGWVPPATTGSVAPTPPTPGGCTTADPFASLGGGSCVNGGWLPPGMGTAAPAPSPAPAPAPSNGCSIPDPFTSIGGGICRNGGWIPRGMAN
jgi:hypothetical protein